MRKNNYQFKNPAYLSATNIDTLQNLRKRYNDVLTTIKTYTSIRFIVDYLKGSELWHGICYSLDPEGDLDIFTVISDSIKSNDVWLCEPPCVLVSEYNRQTKQDPHALKIAIIESLQYRLTYLNDLLRVCKTKD